MSQRLKKLGVELGRNFRGGSLIIVAGQGSNSDAGNCGDLNLYGGFAYGL